MTHIYLDNAAATPLAPQARRAMARAQKSFANPSSFHDAGRGTAALLHGARVGVAKFLRARPDEIIFCSSGSEANALAILGSVQARGVGSVLTTKIEHLSVLESVQILGDKKHKTVFVAVDQFGFVDVESVMRALNTSTTLVSIMYSNNEIGTIQPIARIGALIARWRRAHHSAYPLFHVDACQATTTLDMNVQRLSVDLLTLNGAKAYGPHGSAVLYVRRGVTLEPLVRGGSQEGGRRAGTEDVASACGLAAALELVKSDDGIRLAKLRDRLIEGIMKGVPDAKLNGPSHKDRLVGNVNISIPGCDSESLLLELDQKGIHAGSGSACTAHRVESSHVLVAIGTPKKYLEGVVRFSLGRQTTKREVDAAVSILPSVIARVRSRRARAS